MKKNILEIKEEIGRQYDNQILTVVGMDIPKNTQEEINIESAKLHVYEEVFKLFN